MDPNQQQQPYATGPYGQPQYVQGPPGSMPPPGYPPQQQQYGMGPPYPQQYYPGQMPPPGTYSGVPYGQPVPMQQQVVVVDQPIISGFGNAPTACICPNCKAQITTTVNAEPGAAAWLSCLCLGLIGFWPCMCIPFCIDSCLDVTHTCPNCNVVIRRRSAFD